MPTRVSLDDYRYMKILMKQKKGKNMKTVLKTLSMMLVIVLVLGMMSITAYAAPNTLTITSETSGHTYQAYQVFSGDYSSTVGTLSNVEWGTGINGTGLLADLQASAYGTAAGRTWTGLSASEAADLMSSISDADFAADLADMIEANLGTAGHTDSGAPTGSAGAYTYTISGLADGYFFVNEADLGAGVDNSATSFMLQVLGDVTVAAKTDKPAVAKKVEELDAGTYTGSWNDAADYSIGDAVHFRIVGLVPDMTYFDTYFYAFTDTLSDGLTFDDASVNAYFVSSAASMYAVEISSSVGAGGTILAPASYSVVENAGLPSGFTLTFTDLLTTAGVASNGYIVVEYSAELNSSAEVGNIAGSNDGNPNEVYLTYSNNPNVGTDRGETPKDEVVVFSFELPVAKVDDETPAGALLGATFALFPDSASAAAAVADPTVLTNALYFAGGAGVYTLSDSGSGTQTLASTNPGATYTLSGLDEGTYYLVEIDEPSGYNRLDAAIEVVIDSTYNGTTYVDGHTPDGTYDQLTDVSVNTVTNGTVTVVNEKGSILPETGGIGTTIFTVTGVILMIGAAVLFITKRKVAAHKE